MAIAPTGAIFKSLIFDGESSRDYGVYITGEAVYNAPERAVEMISIPNRNGAFALDKGYYENIEVKYPAGMFATTEAEFRDAIADFRNMLCSRKGYVRLEDEYNPDEYRMAIYKSGLEVDPKKMAGEFEIIFDCMPQRFLKSGEDAVSVSSTDTIDNPTLHEAQPLLEVEGYGEIILNGYVINIQDEPVGEIELVPAMMFNTDYSVSYADKLPLIETGDPMTLESFEVSIKIKTPERSSNPYVKVRSATFTRNTYTIPNYIGTETTVINDREMYKTIKYGAQEFTKQNSTVEYVDSCTLLITLEKADSTTTSWNYTFDLYISNRGANLSQGKGRLVISRRNVGSLPSSYFSTVLWSGVVSAFIADSSQSILGHPTYIDCEIGEAYKEIDGKKYSLNRYIALGSKMPKLSAGENDVEYSGAVTDLTIIPRWWEL